MNDEMPTIGERLASFLDEVGIERAHFATSWIEAVALPSLNEVRPEAIASVTLVCPVGVSESFFNQHEGHLLGIYGNGGNLQVQAGRRVVEGLSAAEMLTLPDSYPMLPWSDISTDHTEAVATAIASLAERVEAADPTETIRELSGGTSDSSITYRVAGSGAPIVFLPLGLAPNQWDAVVARLSDDWCAIELGGRFLGSAFGQYERLASPTYGMAVERLLDRLQIEPGQEVLEVGVGAGPIAMVLARRTDGRNPIVGLDMNRHSLREAAEIAATEGYSEVIRVQEGDATALPFDDNRFDASYSATVFEEVDANAAIGELLRVTKPGGRIGVVVRSNDLPIVWNLDLPPETLRQINVPTDGPVADGGCADSSLYLRFEEAGIRDVETLPTWGTERPPTWGMTLGSARSRLTGDALELFEEALAKGTKDRSAFVSQPFHCAVGTVP